MIISLIHPSRERADKAKETHDFWISQASGNTKIEHILSLDSDDPQLEKYVVLFPYSNIAVFLNSCVVEAANHAAGKSVGEILVYLSDDFKCPKDWDMFIIETVKRATNVEAPWVGDVQWMLRVHDAYQPFENLVLTIPILSRALYKRLGYIFNPLYKSMWVDCDLYAETREVMINAPHLVFKHERLPEDNTYKRSDLNFEAGKALFNERKIQFGWEAPFKIANHL